MIKTPKNRKLILLCKRKNIDIRLHMLVNQNMHKCEQPSNS